MLYIFLLASGFGEKLHLLCDMNTGIPNPLEYRTEVLKDYRHIKKHNTFRQRHPHC